MLKNWNKKQGRGEQENHFTTDNYCITHSSMPGAGSSIKALNSSVRFSWQSHLHAYLTLQYRRAELSLSPISWVFLVSLIGFLSQKHSARQASWDKFSPHPLITRTSALLFNSVNSTTTTASICFFSQLLPPSLSLISALSFFLFALFSSDTHYPPSMQ